MSGAAGFGKLLHRLGVHDYSMVRTYRGGIEERSCIYCGRKHL